MKIKFQPQDKDHPKDKIAATNIGNFFPGEVKGVGDTHEKEARRLIENGDFIETDEDPSGSGGVPKTKAELKADAKAAKKENAKAAADAKATEDARKLVLKSAAKETEQTERDAKAAEKSTAKANANAAKAAKK